METERKLSAKGIRELSIYFSHIFEKTFTIETGL